MRWLLGFTAVVAASCSSSSSTQHISFARLSFDLPTEWQKIDTSRRDVATATWAPEDNASAESIVVIRTELAPTLSHADPATFASLLEEAQASLDEVHATPARPVRTAHGLSGMRIDLDYEPTGLYVPYHRVHVALIDGSSVIHVLYTAREPDPKLAVLEAVLASIHEGEG
jgi:hypothetical protein